MPESELARGACKMTTTIRHKYCESVGIHLTLTMGGTHENRCERGRCSSAMRLSCCALLAKLARMCGIA